MKIIFIRHGNPNYSLDCLTELGHAQAEAAAETLCTMGIEKIYSSSCGRAIETAEHTARKLSYEIHKCDFMREIDWKPKNPESQHTEINPWGRASEYKNKNLPLNDKEWESNDIFSNTNTSDSVEKLGLALDEWFSSLGIEREGYYYRIRKPVHDTVAMFCHAGAYAAAISHIFNLPLPVTLLTLPIGQSGISVIEFKGKEGELVIPRMCMSGNVDHLIKNKIEIT